MNSLARSAMILLTTLCSQSQPVRAEAADFSFATTVLTTQAANKLSELYDMTPVGDIVKGFPELGAHSWTGRVFPLAKLRAIGEEQRRFIKGPTNDDPELGLYFEIKGPLTCEQLRCTLVQSSRELLALIKSNYLMQPFLENRPFTERNINLILFVVDEHGFDLLPPHIGIAKCQGGELTYETIMDELGQPPVVTEVARESFEAALKLDSETTKDRLGL
jgi:hypothetical protein